MGLLVTRFEYPHANDEIIARQRRIPPHRLTGSTVAVDRWPNLERLIEQGVLAKASFVSRGGRRGRPERPLPTSAD